MNEGDLVWAKVKNYPFWPAVVTQPPKASSPTKSKNGCYITFYGTKERGWVKHENCKEYEAHLDEYSKPSKTHKFFPEAVKEIQNEQHRRKIKHESMNCTTTTTKGRKLRKHSSADVML